MRLLLDSDPVTGRQRYFHADATGDNYAIESVHDDTELVEHNRAEFAQIDERARWGEFNKVGSIPMWLYMRLQREGRLDAIGEMADPKPLLKWLQDRDNLKLRTRPGRLV